MAKSHLRTDKQGGPIEARLSAVETELYHVTAALNDLRNRFGLAPLTKEENRQKKRKNSAGKKKIETKKSTSTKTTKGKFVCNGCKKSFKTQAGALWHVGRESKLDGVGSGPCAESKASIKEA